MTQSDANAAGLVRRCIGGEQAAWDELVDRYARLVYSIPRRYGLDETACDDVMQAVFISAFQHLAKLDDPGRVSAWLITTTHRESWRVARASRAKRPGGPPIEDRIADVWSPADDDADRWDRQDRVHRALDALGGRCEELLRALYFQRNEVSYEVIATQLDIPIGSIGPSRARCLQKMERLLREQGMDWGVERGGEEGTARTAAARAADGAERSDR